MIREKNTLIKYLIFIIISLSSCSNLFEDEPGTDPVTVFENIWNTFNEEYAPFEERGVNWLAEYQEFRSQVNQNSTEDDLFNALSGLLATLDDGHVTLTVPGKEIFVSNRIIREKIDDQLFDMDLITSGYLEQGFIKGEEDSYIYGKVKGENLGYIYLKYIDESLYVFDEFLDSFENSSGIIIDLRHNDGGDFTYSFSEMRRLVNEKQFVFRSKTKNGTGKDDYTPWKEWFVEPSGRFFNKPVVVLTDRYTISAGERTVMALGSLAGVTVIGDTTNGAHGTMIGREASNGWYYSLVPQKVELANGQSLEGTGLPPDVYVKTNPDEMNSGTDRVLATAIQTLK